MRVALRVDFGLSISRRGGGGGPFEVPRQSPTPLRPAAAITSEWECGELFPPAHCKKKGPPQTHGHLKVAAWGLEEFLLTPYPTNARARRTHSFHAFRWRANANSILAAAAIHSRRRRRRMWELEPACSLFGQGLSPQRQPRFRPIWICQLSFPAEMETWQGPVAVALFCQGSS